MQVISSKDNRIVKEAASLADRKYRDRLGLYLVEGPNLVREAMELGNRVRFIFTRAGTQSEEVMQLADLADGRGLAVYELTSDVFAKVTQTETPQDILGVFEKRQYDRNDFFKSVGEGNVLVLDRLQDPGNAGTLIRTCEAMGFKGVLAIKGTTDLYQPKVVRAAAGSLLRLPVLFCQSGEEALELLSSAGKTVFAAAMNAELSCCEAKLDKNAAVVVGNEGGGISGLILENAVTMRIPMEGPTESLNAAVAGSMIMYESLRQRKDILK